MTRHIRRYWFAGIVAFLVGGFAASANEPARVISLQRIAANVLFFPYPAIVSTVAARPVRPQHLRYLFKGMDVLDAVTLSKYNNSIHPDLSQVARLYPQGALPNSLPAPVKPRDDITSEDDEWHFHANPQLGVNHEHEKGMTFSVRRDF
jgi:hypothetical protein